MATIRHARPEDASAIAAVWNPVIRETTITFNSVEWTVAEVATMIERRTADGLPWLVAEREGRAAGFATFAQFRGGIGYARTMEHSVILAPEARGRAIGRALMDRLVEEARTREARSLVAAISGENAPGLAFHARLGFVEVGRVQDAGRKFGRWLDLVLMQLRLTEKAEV